MSNGKQRRQVKNAPGTKKGRVPNKYTLPGQYEASRQTVTLTEACVDGDGNPFNDSVDVVVVTMADRLPDVS